MRVGQIGHEEVLVTTDDSGHVVVHFLKDDYFSRAPLNLKMPMSAWGIDTHPSKRLLAISCNAQIINIFHLGMGIEGWTWTTKVPDESEEGVPNIILRGHTDNIPCVAFDSTGTFLVSGSIDYTIRLWECKSGQLLRTILGGHAYESHCTN
jgi:WD40 repeat protein